MATNSWLGDYPARARVIRLTVGGTVANGDTITYTIGGVAVGVTAATGNTKAVVAAALHAALSASADPRFKESLWSYAEGDEFVTGTASAAGVPFAGAASDTGTTTLTESEVTSSTGPNHVDEPLNWSLGTLPDAGEDVVIDVPVDMLYGWSNVPAAAYASLQIKAAFEAALGLPARNPSGYAEYRTRFWTIATAVPLAVGEGDGQGPKRCNVQITTALAAVVHKTGLRQTATEPVLTLIGASSGTLAVAAGDVAVSGALTSAAVDGEAVLTVIAGGTVATVSQSGGTLVGYGTVVALNTTGGNATLYEAPTTVTADAGAGTVDFRFTGTATTVTFRGQGAQGAPVCECGSNPRARTFTNCAFTGGARLSDPDKTVTFTNPGTWDRASLAASDLGSRFSLQRT